MTDKAQGLKNSLGQNVPLSDMLGIFGCMFFNGVVAFLAQQNKIFY
jgi:hypothetical protein